jgi:hypothetical protein
LKVNAVPTFCGHSLPLVARQTAAHEVKDGLLGPLLMWCAKRILPGQAVAGSIITLDRNDYAKLSR